MRGCLHVTSASSARTDVPPGGAARTTTPMSLARRSNPMVCRKRRRLPLARMYKSRSAEDASPARANFVSNFSSSTVRQDARRTMERSAADTTSSPPRSLQVRCDDVLGAPDPGRSPIDAQKERRAVGDFRLLIFDLAAERRPNFRGSRWSHLDHTFRYPDATRRRLSQPSHAIKAAESAAVIEFLTMAWVCGGGYDDRG